MKRSPNTALRWSRTTAGIPVLSPSAFLCGERTTKAVYRISHRSLMLNTQVWADELPGSRGLLFLDHSGNGWHPQSTTGIVRNDVNAGIQLYFLLADAATIAGCAGELLPLFVKPFVPMLERGATTTWESFGGEVHDSLNHAWSAVLPYLVHRGIAGIQPAAKDLILQPDLTAVRSFDFSAPLPKGRVRVAWTYQSPDTVLLEIEAPRKLRARLVLPGRTVTVKDGRYRRKVAVVGGR